MSDYFNPTMRLYVDRLVNWDEILRLRRGDGVDRDSEVGAYRTVLETIASLAQSFERPARENWAAEAELIPADGGAQSLHIMTSDFELRGRPIPIGIGRPRK